jgi:hypothetical protein
MQKGGTFLADVHERGLHTWKDRFDHALVDTSGHFDVVRAFI